MYNIMVLIVAAIILQMYSSQVLVRRSSYDNYHSPQIVSFIL